MDICYGLDCVPKKDMLKSQSLVPVNVTLSESRVFTDLWKEHEMHHHYTKQMVYIFFCIPLTGNLKVKLNAI